MLGVPFPLTSYLAACSQGAFCMFNPNLLRAQLVNNLCFQIPLVLTILINLWAYVKVGLPGRAAVPCLVSSLTCPQGLHALRDAPQSVIAREMRRAGIYMSVLLVVWIPNFIGEAAASPCSRERSIQTDALISSTQ